MVLVGPFENAPVRVVRRIVHLRIKHRLAPVQIADRLGMQASSVHAVLVRCRLNRLTHLDRVTGEPVRRYEHDRPGDLLHIDVKLGPGGPTVAVGATWALSRASETGS